MTPVPPEGWRFAPLGEIAEAVRGVTFPSHVATRLRGTATVACLTTSSVQDEIAWDVRSYIPDEYVRSSAQFLRAGDILVSTANSKALVGKSCLLGDLPEPATFGAFVTALRTDSASADALFLSYYLRSAEALDYAFTKSSNTTNISNLKVSELVSQAIPLPPLSEQRRIAAILRDQLDAVRRAREAALARLDAARTLPAAFLAKSFNGIVPLSVGDGRDTAPPGWAWQRLTDLSRLESGHTPSRYHPEWWGGDIPWIALTDIRKLDGKVAYQTTEYTNELGIDNSSARVLPAGTVVLSRTASVGFVTVMGRDMATSQDFVNWVCGDTLDFRFLAYLLRASRSYIRSLSSGAVHETVYMPTVKAFQVCVPVLSEQCRLADHLDKLMSVGGRARGIGEAEQVTIEALPQSLLRSAFAGEL